MAAGSSRNRRVVTLLPAATEIVAALGGTNNLVGVSHECDYPPAVRGLPRRFQPMPVPSAASSSPVRLRS